MSQGPGAGAPVAPEPLGRSGFHELRVHGVAGSAPADMLGLAPELDAVDVRREVADCAVAQRPEDITLWRAPEVDPALRAWSWGSLTSGHWYQAFYLLLLPFMIANVAGWMAVGRGAGRDATVRASAFLVRAVGLLVTVVFVVATQLVVADVVAWQWLHQRLGWPQWVAGLGVAVTALVLLGTVGLTRLRRRPASEAVPEWQEHRDPVGLSSLRTAQHLMWNSPLINVTLRRLHLAGGLAALALLAAWPAPGAGDGGWWWARVAAFGLAVATAAVVVALLARVSLGDGTAGMPAVMTACRRTVWPAALAVAVAALLPIGLPERTAQSWIVLPGLRGAAAWLALAIVAGVVALLVAGLVARRDRRVVNAPAVLLLAAAIGGAVGAGLAGQTARLVEGDCTRDCLVVGDQVTWLAVGVTASLAVLIVVGAVRAGAQRLRSRAGRETTLPALTRRGSWITWTIALAGGAIAGTGAVVAVVRPGGLPPVSDVPPAVAWTVVGVVVVPIVAGAARWAWTAPARAAGATRSRTRTLRALALAVLAAVIGLVVAALALGWTVEVLGVPLPPRTFADFALDVAVLLPTAALLTRVYSGLTDRGARRGVGVLWDVGTFWPRWFHPLAPPTYSDRAVVRLAAQLDADLAEGHRILLAPHSQGAVIAAAAVLCGGPRPGLAMLSHGSPWQRLYAEFFPSHVDAATTDALRERLTTGGVLRWRNLHRESDPIGGAIDGVPEEAALPDPCRRGHSRYWLEGAYRERAHELRALLDGAPAPVPPDDAPQGVRT